MEIIAVRAQVPCTRCQGEGQIHECRVCFKDVTVGQSGIMSCGHDSDTQLINEWCSRCGGSKVEEAWVSLADLAEALKRADPWYEYSQLAKAGSAKQRQEVPA